MKTLQTTLILNHIFLLTIIALFALSNTSEVNTTQTLEQPASNDTQKPFNLTYEMEKAFSEYMKQRKESKKEETNTNQAQTQQVTDDREKTVQELIQEIESEETAEELQARKDREEFERQVGNFSFSNLLTLMVKSHEGESLYENITSVPTTMRIAYMVNHPTKVIDFTVSGPLKNGKKGIIKNIKAKNHAFIELEITSPGLVTFFLNNYKYKENSKITFALNADQKEDKTIETKSFDEMSERLKFVDNRINELRMKGNLVVRKIEGHNKSASKHNRSIIILTVIEVIVMVMIFIIQSYYLRKLLSKA